VVISPGDWIWRELGEPLSVLFEGVAHLAPSVSWLLLLWLYLLQFSGMSHHTHLVQLALFI
jgi:hypothetical protein